MNSAVVQDPSTFVASSGGVGVDTNVAQQLAQFQELPLDSQNGATMADLYDQMASSVTQGSSVAKSLSDGAADFASSLQGQQQAISGVNIDEETVNMLAISAQLSGLGEIDLDDRRFVEHLVQLERGFQRSVSSNRTIRLQLETRTRIMTTP